MTLLWLLLANDLVLDVFDRASDDTAGVFLQFELCNAAQTACEKVPVDTPIYEKDNIAFHLVPSKDGYIYVLNQGPEDNERQLIPGSAQAVRAGTATRVPDEGAFPVDDTVGTERVWILFSEDPIEPPKAHVAVTPSLASAPTPTRVHPEEIAFKSLDGTATKGLGPAVVAQAVSGDGELWFGPVELDHLAGQRPR